MTSNDPPSPERHQALIVQGTNTTHALGLVVLVHVLFVAVGNPQNLNVVSVLWIGILGFLVWVFCVQGPLSRRLPVVWVAARTQQ